MAKTKTTFQLDLTGGAAVLQVMAAPEVRKSANAISQRAGSMASSMSSNPPNIRVSTEVGVIKRGLRAIATVSGGGDARQTYIAHEAIKKAVDAGKVR